MFEFQEISHAYDESAESLILQGISFEVRRGECVGLTGPSGSGKSTLAQIGAGFIIPSNGRVLVDSKDLTGVPSRDVALIQQDSDLFPWLKVAKQIMFAQEERSNDDTQALIELVKLTGFENHYPAQLSGGMKKRLALARALAVKPKLLILDESFSSLDVELKTELFKDLKTIWEQTQTTILLITHDSRDLDNLAHREVRLTNQRPAGVSEIIAYAAYNN